jgi:hypothetical protein
MSKQTVFWSAVILLLGAVVFAVGLFSGRGLASQNPPVYSLSPGVTGMINGGAGYVYDGSTAGDLPVEEVTGAVQRYLDRLDNPDLALARLRKFRWAYQAEVVERSTGRHAFGLMVGKATADISPKAGPNLFWNTKYGSMIAEVGGGYGMVGRLLPQSPASDMPLTESEALGIAENAVKQEGSGLKLDDKTATFYGFYEFHTIRDGELVGELDVNGYNGQVWYEDWGEPQLSVQNLLGDQ